MASQVQAIVGKPNDISMRVSDADLTFLKDLWTYDCPPLNPPEAACPAILDGKCRDNNYMACSEIGDQVLNPETIDTLKLRSYQVEILKCMCAAYINSYGDYKHTAENFFGRLSQLKSA